MLATPEWIKRRLDPSARLGEILFGLIMALGFTGAVGFGLEEPDNRQLFVSILGCNIAWGIVDGVMYVLGELFDRGRKARVVKEVLSAPSDAAAIERLDREIDGWLFSVMSPDERDRVNRGVLELIRREKPVHSGLRADDLLSGLAVAVLIVLSTLPVVLPYLFIQRPEIAVRVSNLVALGLLFLLGSWWGRMIGSSSWKMGTGLTVIGVALVLVTIALGG